MDLATRINQKKKISLVLSGGGIKASAFHIGVCLALREKGFVFAGGTKDEVLRRFPGSQPRTIRSYVGSSAGAFVTAVLASGHTLEGLINAFNVGIGESPRFPSPEFARELKPIGYKTLFRINGRNLLFSLPKSLMQGSIIRGGWEALIKSKFRLNGIFSTKGIESYLRKYALTHNDFNDLGVDLFVVGTQLNHTRKVIFGPFSETTKSSTLMFASFAKISEAVAASVALPPIYTPFGIDSGDNKVLHFFDGEIRDTLSTHVAADHGADLVISSYSVQPYHFTPEIGSLHEYGIPTILNQALYQLIQQKIQRHITHEQEIRSLYQSIDKFSTTTNLSKDQRESLLQMVCDKLNFKPKVDYIYIHPRSQDYEMFFADHFSLNPKNLEKIVSIGFRSAIHSLKLAGL